MVPTTAQREADSGFVVGSNYIIDVSWADAMSYGGHRFFYSDNEVLLSPGRGGIIEPIFIRGIWEAHSGRYWRNPEFMEYSRSGAHWPGRDRITRQLEDETRWMRTRFTWRPNCNEPSQQWLGLSDEISVGYTYTVLMVNGQPDTPGSRPPSRAPSQGPSDASWLDVSRFTPAQVTQAADQLFRQAPWVAA